MNDEHRPDRALGQDAHFDVARAAVQADDDGVGAVGQVNELLFLRQDFARQIKTLRLSSSTVPPKVSNASGAGSGMISTNIRVESL